MLNALASGDFSALADVFMAAGYVVQQPCVGVVQICAAQSDVERLRLFISVGIHGDETAPIDMLALLLEELRQHPQQLKVDLMIAVGNLPAIAAKKRFIDVDLNRLFTLKRTSAPTQEAQRADQLMQAATQFFAGHAHKWHLDLHSAIRASLYPSFAIVPGKANLLLVQWLGAAGIDAVVLSPQPSVTFSSFTCAQLGAVSCTAELGRVGQLGQNDLTPFITLQRAIAELMRSFTPEANESPPLIFCVTQELIKHSDQFQLAFDKATPNFTQFAPHTVLATDGSAVYSVGETPEYVLFPNPDVHIGLRAGVMVRRI